jgi:tetratricopeptide (TPR) repeat protein
MRPFISSFIKTKGSLSQVDMKLFLRLFGIALFLSLAQALYSGTPEQVADWKLRFQKGVALEKQGLRDEALAVFTQILAEDPQARGSLLMSGLIHLKQGQAKKALDFLEKFQQLEPTHEGGLIAMIKVHQSLGQMEQVERYRKKMLEERNSKKNPLLAQLLSYEREVVPLADGNSLSILENLEQGPERFIWSYVVLDKKNTVLRRLEWTRIKASTSMQYALGEAKLQNGLTDQYKIHRLLNEEPDYLKARELALTLLKP